jgi:hypothetical protein
MAKGKLVVLSNPTSNDQEEAYNRWYNDIHAAEVVALDGFRSMTRFRVVHQVAPAGAKPTHRYLAIYELDDVELAMQQMATKVDDLDMSGPIDVATALGATFEPFFTYEKKGGKTK